MPIPVRKPIATVKTLLSACDQALSTAIVVGQTTIRGIANDWRDEDGITELSVMLIVAGILTLAASTAAVAVQGGVGNVVNGITNRLAAA